MLLAAALALIVTIAPLILEDHRAFLPAGLLPDNDPDSCYSTSTLATIYLTGGALTDKAYSMDCIPHHLEASTPRATRQPTSAGPTAKPTLENLRPERQRLAERLLAIELRLPRWIRRKERARTRARRNNAMKIASRYRRSLLPLTIAHGCQNGKSYSHLRHSTHRSSTDLHKATYYFVTRASTVTSLLHTTRTCRKLTATTTDPPKHYPIGGKRSFNKIQSNIPINTSNSEHTIYTTSINAVIHPFNVSAPGHPPACSLNTLAKALKTLDFIQINAGSTLYQRSKHVSPSTHNSTNKDLTTHAPTFFALKEGYGSAESYGEHIYHVQVHKEIQLINVGCTASRNSLGTICSEYGPQLDALLSQHDSALKGKWSQFMHFLENSWGGGAGQVAYRQMLYICELIECYSSVKPVGWAAYAWDELDDNYGGPEEIMLNAAKVRLFNSNRADLCSYQSVYGSLTRSFKYTEGNSPPCKRCKAANTTATLKLEAPIAIKGTSSQQVRYHGIDQTFNSPANTLIIQHVDYKYVSNTGSRLASYTEVIRPGEVDTVAVPQPPCTSSGTCEWSLTAWAVTTANAQQYILKSGFNAPGEAGHVPEAGGFYSQYDGWGRGKFQTGKWAADPPPEKYLLRRSVLITWTAATPTSADVKLNIQHHTNKSTVPIPSPRRQLLPLDHKWADLSLPASTLAASDFLQRRLERHSWILSGKPNTTLHDEPFTMPTDNVCHATDDGHPLTSSEVGHTALAIDSTNTIDQDYCTGRYLDATPPLAGKRGKREERLRIDATHMREQHRWRRHTSNDHGETVQYYNDYTWIDWVRLAPANQGMGAFALHSHRPTDPVLPYFGKLVPLRDNPEASSNKVMQSGLKPYAVVGSDNSPSGSVFINDVRGTGKQPNVRYSCRINVNKTINDFEPKQLDAFLKASAVSGELISKPQAVGKVVPIYVATKHVSPGDELLADYHWTEEEWANAAAFDAINDTSSGSSSGTGSGSGSGSDSGAGYSRRHKRHHQDAGNNGGSSNSSSTPVDASDAPTEESTVVPIAAPTDVLTAQTRANPTSKAPTSTLLQRTSFRERIRNKLSKARLTSQAAKHPQAPKSKLIRNKIHERPGGQGATYSTVEVLPDPWATRQLQNINAAESWTEVGNLLFDGDNLWNYDTCTDPNYSSVVFHNVDGIDYSAGTLEEACSDYNRGNCAVWCGGDVRIDPKSKHQLEYVTERYFGEDTRFSHSIGRTPRWQPSIGETTIAVGGPLQRYMHNYIADSRSLGRYAATIIKGKKDGSVQRNLLIVSVYANMHGGFAEEEQVAATIEARNQGKRTISAFELMLNDIVDMCRKHPNVDILVGGDWNANPRSKDKEHRARTKLLKKFCSSLGLLNVLHELHPKQRFVTYTGTNDTLSSANA